ncbi:tetratricopeptide TPR_2 repeat protein [Luminiphilus syltensis NOR5-1B]|uniref:Cell division coordinator CpoB n=1 Tax=Luminiphilus syltensis NOR5-1B TaxID=565045 RepID=B8KS58_9GAMM|nr:tol-pal system protein YbgF [Luminiphilus syltensis]EED34742.1 tetratricopeptide TPR_2 repeat protein [Luminiphilus syltensis NOR5-1B]
MNWNLPVKPALVAGFFVYAMSFPAGAQDYIDVEAERAAAERQRLQQAPSSPMPGAANPSSTAVGIRPYSGTTLAAEPIVESQADGGGAINNAGDLVIQIQQLQAEVRRLNGLVEEQSQQIQQLQEQSLERYIDIDRRLAGLSGGAPLNPAAADAGRTAPSVSPPVAGSGASDVQATPAEEAAYQSAYELVKQRRFAPAVSAFKAFLGDYPFGRYAPNAHYWLGELYLVVDPAEPEMARQSFKLLLDQYPNNPKIPDALYKLGRVHYIKGNRQRSKEYLDRAIREYGQKGHPAAQLAQDFLDQNF